MLGLRRRELGFAVNRMFSSDLDRQNDTPEIDATMKKMTMPTVLARP